MTRAECRAYLKREAAKWPPYLVQIQRELWPDLGTCAECRLPVEAWKSSQFVVLVFAEGGKRQDGISWDELQEIKSEMGRGDRFAVEIFPATNDLVNVANLRHLWILPEPPPFAWRRSAK